MMLGIIREKVSNNWYILHINPLFLSFNDNLSETSEYILNLLQPNKIKEIIINCAKLDRLTELHILGFLSLIKESTNLNKKISFCGISPEILKRLSAIGLDKIFLIYDNEKDALANL